MAKFASDEALGRPFRSDVKRRFDALIRQGVRSGGEPFLKMGSFVKLQEMVVVFGINLRNNETH
jgi:hypothetical protein